MSSIDFREFVISCHYLFFSWFSPFFCLFIIFADDIDVYLFHFATLIIIIFWFSISSIISAPFSSSFHLGCRFFRHKIDCDYRRHRRWFLIIFLISMIWCKLDFSFLLHFDFFIFAVAIFSFRFFSFLLMLMFSSTCLSVQSRINVWGSDWCRHDGGEAAADDVHSWRQADKPIIFRLIFHYWLCFLRFRFSDMLVISFSLIFSWLIISMWLISMPHFQPLRHYFSRYFSFLIFRCGVL